MCHSRRVFPRLLVKIRIGVIRGTTVARRCFGACARLSACRFTLAACALVAGWAAGGRGCDARLGFVPAGVARHRMLEGAGPDFLLGVATSAHQIEGGTRNDWTDWERGRYDDGAPHVAGGASAARAADSWNL